MPTDVVMPQMGESIFEGTITRWLKQPGDRVERDEPLLEISTDKVDAEIPAPVSGILSEIKVATGETVQVNTVIAVIGGSPAAPFSAVPTSAAPASSAPVPVPAAVAASTVAASWERPAAPQASPVQEVRRIRSSPLVRRMVRENKLDLGQIAGTGSAGRITKEDVLRHLSQGAVAAAAPAKAASTPAATPASSLPAAAAQAGDRVVPLSRMRAIIAERMVESMRVSPHVHAVYRIDMTRIASLRERSRSAFEQRHGVKLTYMPFIAVAAVEALRHHPVLNASLLDNAIHYHAHVHLGIAVALEWGLIVPVIRESEARSFVGIAQAIGDLAARARTKKLSADEAQGSTFSLTNFGVFGGDFGTPIINQPESAILAIGGLRKEPVVVTADDGGDTIAIRAMQTYCLGFDHRLIDGADAGRFMSTFKNTLENWDREIG
ncbi:MAG TPA: dihydrolipoamide acetyltransferase family protein [Terracidiphilus sp.]|nr:dihydrolipoamide acetyltransferase family protein [Terracidiphilus sp.]